MHHIPTEYNNVRFDIMAQQNMQQNRPNAMRSPCAAGKTVLL